MDEKRCPHCGVVKRIVDFHRAAGRPDGHAAWCKPCKSVMRKARYETDATFREHVKEHMRGAVRTMSPEQRERQRLVNRLFQQKRRATLEGRALERARYSTPAGKAKSKVHDAVRKGKLPSARTLICAECGMQAAEYHHHRGYDPEYFLDVIPLCRKCHGRTRHL